MSNCNANQRNTRSAARTLRKQLLCLLQSCYLGICIICFVCVSVEAFLKMKNTMQYSKEIFFCFSAALTAYNSVPNPRLDTSKTLFGVRISNQLLSFLFCLLLSCFVCFLIYNQLSMCQRALSRLQFNFFTYCLLLRNKENEDKHGSDLAPFTRVSVCPRLSLSEEIIVYLMLQIFPNCVLK